MIAPWSESGKVIHCDQWHRWQSSFSLDPRSVPLDELKSRLANVRLDSTSLIWLDSCDVRTTKAAVDLAKSSGATLHVGQSSGTQAIKRVHSSQGWMGTTLSEIGARSDCIITIGNGVLIESPLLASRFFHPYGRTGRPFWIHIAPGRSLQSLSIPTGDPIPDVSYGIEHSDWYAWLCQVAAEVGGDARLVNRQLSATDLANASEVARKITQSQHVVWIWDADELHFETDELLIRRLLTFADQLENGSSSRRSLLLPLDMNLGRVTADETMLWLTGRSTTAAWRDEQWTSPARFEGISLDEWQSAFDTIVLVSNVPSPRSLPHIKATLTLQTPPSTSPGQIQVAAVGIDCSGHLFRGDKAVVGYLPATNPTSTLHMASTILELLRD
jgi:hypothetical protein